MRDDITQSDNFFQHVLSAVRKELATMRTLRNKWATYLMVAMIILSSLVPATVWAQDEPLGGETPVVIDWDVLVQVAERLPGFVPGRPSGNPGPLIEWLDRRAGNSKTEHLDNSAWEISGPALFWGGIYDPQVSRDVLAGGAQVVSCQGSNARLGTCVLVIPEGKAITLNNTGATVGLKDFNGTMPAESSEIMITNQKMGFPTQCIEAAVPATVTEMDAMAETAGELSKVSGRDHFYAMYRLTVPAEKTLLLWTTGAVNGATLIAIDPGVAKIYLAEPGLVIVQGSFQGVALCAPPEVAEDTDTASGEATAEVCPAGAEEAAFVAVDDLKVLLESEVSAEDIAACFPNATYSGPFTKIDGAMILMLTGTNPGDGWMNVGKAGNGPYVNISPEGEVAEGTPAVILDRGLDPECDLGYWPNKPDRCG